MPAWSTIVLDGALGARVLQPHEIADLDVNELVDVAAAFVRASAAGQAFDSHEAVRAARATTADARRGRREQLRRERLSA
jgi:hypothetical protein